MRERMFKRHRFDSITVLSPPSAFTYTFNKPAKQTEPLWSGANTNMLELTSGLSETTLWN